MSHHRLVTESIQSMVTHKQNSHFQTFDLRSCILLTNNYTSRPINIIIIIIM